VNYKRKVNIELPMELTKVELSKWIDNVSLDITMQRKMDGIRAKLISDKGSATWYDRSGCITLPPTAVGRAVKTLPKDVRMELDGEIIGDQFFIFDIMVNGNRRREFLDQFPPIDHPTLKRVPISDDYESPAAFLQEMRDVNAEGVVFREIPSGKAYKFKFVKQADCIVIDINVNGKQNLELAVWDDQKLVSVGMVSALTGDGPTATLGDIVQVNYLYSTESNRLYQPTKPKVRVDKAPEQCTIDQLLTNRKGMI